jgi:hypothetical protein
MGILFLIPLLPYGPYELEDVQHTILPNQVFYTELFHGRWIYWLNNLGFGAPMPLGIPLMFHPVFAPLIAFTSLRVTMTTVWLVQMAVMVFYFLRLAAATDIRLPGLRLVLTAFLVASAPSIFYFYRRTGLSTWSPGLCIRSWCSICGRRLWRGVRTVLAHCSPPRIAVRVLGHQRPSGVRHYVRAGDDRPMSWWRRRPNGACTSVSAQPRRSASPSPRRASILRFSVNCGCFRSLRKTVALLA